jgi:hypothetical protein
VRVSGFGPEGAMTSDANADRTRTARRIRHHRLPHRDARWKFDESVAVSPAAAVAKVAPVAAASRRCARVFDI